MRAHGMRLVGPNVSGIDQSALPFAGPPCKRSYLYKTPITFICQGAYAITDRGA